MQFMVAYKCNNLNFHILTEMVTLPFVLNVTELFLCGNFYNKTFIQYINNSNIQNKDNDKNNSNSLVLKLPPNLKSVFNQFNISYQTHDFKDPENVVKGKYYNLEEIQTMKIPNKKTSFFIPY